VGLARPNMRSQKTSRIASTSTSGFQRTFIQQWWVMENTAQSLRHPPLMNEPAIRSRFRE